MDFFYFVIQVYLHFCIDLYIYIRMIFSLYKFILLIISLIYNKVGIIFYEILRNLKYFIFIWNYEYSLSGDLIISIILIFCRIMGKLSRVKNYINLCKIQTNYLHYIKLKIAFVFSIWLIFSIWKNTFIYSISWELSIFS